VSDDSRVIAPNETVIVALTGTEARCLYSELASICSFGQQNKRAELFRSVLAKLRAVGIKDGFNVVPGER
jgi:hypothetical protein